MNFFSAPPSNLSILWIHPVVSKEMLQVPCNILPTQGRSGPLLRHGTGTATLFRSFLRFLSGQEDRLKPYWVYIPVTVLLPGAPPLGLRYFGLSARFVNFCRATKCTLVPDSPTIPTPPVTITFTLDYTPQPAGLDPTINFHLEPAEEYFSGYLSRFWYPRIHYLSWQHSMRLRGGRRSHRLPGHCHPMMWSWPVNVGTWVDDYIKEMMEEEDEEEALKVRARGTNGGEFGNEVPPCVRWARDFEPDAPVLKILGLEHRQRFQEQRWGGCYELTEEEFDDVEYSDDEVW
ncbi:hypothetical protein EDC01DRAFT_746909 [Geopyxis carbonaria]|nr:hypothetical protein EDC01DRAFT_746909 [Geopyxis carbonaria]